MKKYKYYLIAYAVFTVFAVFGLATTVSAATITVDSTADTAATDGECTFREAINNVNAAGDTTGGDCVAATGFDDIEFGIAGGGVHTITLGSALPDIDAQVSIDATTEEGADCTTKDLMVEIVDGAGVDIGLDFTINAAGSLVDGLVIRGFADSGVRVTGDIGLRCNIIGLEADGETIPADQNGTGVKVYGEFNIIGGVVEGQGNIISGNAADGILLPSTGDGAVGTEIFGNYVGLNAAGDTARANDGNGIVITDNASDTLVGYDDTATSGNVISGNGARGIYIGSSAEIYNNYVGLNAVGDAAVANGVRGIEVSSAAGVVIGDVDGLGNVISGNTERGVYIDTSDGTQFVGNYVGINASGDAAIANGQVGIYVINSDAVVIGGSLENEGNVISGNTQEGILIDNSTNTEIYGNYIGLNVAGDAAIGNVQDGIEILANSTGNFIGGTGEFEGNVVSGNGEQGIIVSGDETEIYGNYIGLNAIGDAGIGNEQHGIEIDSATDVVIGSAVLGAGNVISDNGDMGIKVEASEEVSIDGNYIGLNAAGDAAIGNAFLGLLLDDGVVNANVGLLASNVVSGNGFAGVGIFGECTDINVLNNYVGTNIDGAVEDGFGNGHTPGGMSPAGIMIQDSTEVTIGGLDGSTGNVIAGNEGAGVLILQLGVLGEGHTSVLGNSIFSNEGLGIDLAVDDDEDFVLDNEEGVTANDGGDVDTGPNDLLNFIVVDSFEEEGEDYVVNFDLDVPAGDYIVQFFSNTETDESGNGEGQVLLGTAEITHTGGGEESFEYTLDVDLGDIVTATVTEDLGASYGVTSEFSLAVEVELEEVSSGGGSSSGSKFEYNEFSYEDILSRLADEGIITKDLGKNADKCEALTIMARIFEWEISVAESSQFSDVPEWCNDVANYAYDQGIVEGVSEGVLGVENMLSRFEFVTMVYRYMEGKPVSIDNPFVDELVEWARDAVLWAYANEVVTGYENGNFGGNDPILKQDIGVILFRLLN